MQLTRDPRTEERADEAKGEGHDEPALRSAAESLADRAADFEDIGFGA